jgi:hypothetical protein
MSTTTPISRATEFAGKRVLVTGGKENAVKLQIWIAVSVYVLVAIIKKRLNLSASLYEILQILSLTMFERTPLDQLLTLTPQEASVGADANQMNLFE